MPLEAILTMVIVVGTVWGGFVFVLTLALKKERQKSATPS